MCGIAGFHDSIISTEKGITSLKTMLTSIQHRGPDYTDSWNQENAYLGHNRLSIIDLDSRSNQPFHYEDLVMIFNGEVYNYLELKKELIDLGYSFTTESDTEVVIAAYKCWGEKSVERMMGMWAFAIYNTVEKTWFFSRDRFGIKPLYFHRK